MGGGSSESSEAAFPTKGPSPRTWVMARAWSSRFSTFVWQSNLGRSHRIPLLFCGKVDLLDMVTLHQLEEEGLVEQPKFIPPPFDDIPSLASTLSLGGFTAMLDWDRLQSDYSVLI